MFSVGGPLPLCAFAPWHETFFSTKKKSRAKAQRREDNEDSRGGNDGRRNLALIFFAITRRWTAPHVTAELTSSDYRANNEPASSAALGYTPRRSLAELLNEALERNDLALALHPQNAAVADRLKQLRQKRPTNLKRIQGESST